MQYIRENAPTVVKDFYALTESISNYAPFDEKTKELMLCGIFAASGAESTRGLGHHVERAAQLGATREEVLGAILLILPVVGITHTTLAMDEAARILGERK
ncbi:MAG TPA: carboxymuconolactone decarboxylase family protein [Ktedonobacteraceae bacterium]|nr:carboxymuconolactone decarboxylase family protein [Ktedonobacteraceae bacterium]